MLGRGQNRDRRTRRVYAQLSPIFRAHFIFVGGILIPLWSLSSPYIWLIGDIIRHCDAEGREEECICVLILTGPLHHEIN